MTLPALSTGRKTQVSKQPSSLESINKKNKTIKMLRARQLPGKNQYYIQVFAFAVIHICPRSMGLEFLAVAWSLIDWGDVRAVLNREMTLKETPATYWHRASKGESHGRWLSCSSATNRTEHFRGTGSSLGRRNSYKTSGLIFDWNEQYQPPLIQHLGKAGSAGQNAPSLSISSKQPLHFALPIANTGIFNLQFISACQRWKALSN